MVVCVVEGDGAGVKEPETLKTKLVDGRLSFEAFEELVVVCGGLSKEG